MNSFRNFAVWIIIAFVLIALFNLFQSPMQKSESNNITYSELLGQAEIGKVKDVTITDEFIKGHYTNGLAFTTVSPRDNSELMKFLHEKGVSVEIQNETNSVFYEIFLSYLPIIILIAVWIFLFRQMQGANGRAMGFGKSRAKLLTEAHGKVTFEDVAGIDEAKEDLEEVVEFLSDPSRFQRLGGRIPKGVLLIGPPGTGKTLLARAIAGEANVPFFSISGSDFVEMFVGVGASRVRDMFSQAKKNSPCIIFIDEIDAVGRHRGAGLGGGNDEREQTLNQLLVEMDGFEANEGVILVAATNRPDVLDPALLRPGRFDRQVVVPNPDINGRKKILEVHSRKIRISPDADLQLIARGTPGFSGADLANIINESALLAARRNKRMVTQKELEDAKDKVMMGSERRSLAMSEEEKKLTAYHEGGHALVALHMKGSDPIHKATIIPRGRALGMVMRLPERDQLSLTRQKMEADLAVAMGGRVAEEIIFGHEMVTSGASSDIKMATNLARAMVTKFGMSDILGPLAYGDNEEEVFLGHSVARTQNMSNETQKMVDNETKKLVNEGYDKAKEILNKYIKDLHIISDGLIEYETLSGDEIKGLIKGEKPHKDEVKIKEDSSHASVPLTDEEEDESNADKEAENKKAKDDKDPNPEPNPA